MRRIIWVIALLLVVVLPLVSCARASEKKFAVAEVGKIAPSAVPVPMPAVREEAYALREGGAGATAAVSLAAERMIIRTGDVSLVVEDVLEARDKIAQLAVGLDGYVVSSWLSGEGREMRGNISFRVPDERFEPTLAALRKLAVRVEQESTSSQDVTEEYVDQEARLKNAEATEKQYLALLDKAKDVPEMLSIYDSLSRVRREIEQIKGRMKYLERTSSMSLINVHLQPAATAKPLIPVRWSALEALKSAIRGLATFGQWLVTGLIWLMLLIPIWGTILGVIWWRRRRKVVH